MGNLPSSQDGAEGALSEAISSLSPDAGSVAGLLDSNLDAKVSEAGGSAPNPTPGAFYENTDVGDVVIDLSGSGRVLDLLIEPDGTECDLEIVVDGSTFITKDGGRPLTQTVTISSFRFESGLTISDTNPYRDGTHAMVVVVFD